MPKRIDDNTVKDVKPIMIPRTSVPIKISIMTNPNLTLPEMILVIGKILVCKEETIIPRKRFVKHVVATRRTAKIIKNKSIL